MSTSLCCCVVGRAARDEFVVHPFAGLDEPEAIIESAGYRVLRFVGEGGLPVSRMSGEVFEQRLHRGLSLAFALMVRICDETAVG
jgi:hypothetical protein